MGPFLALFSPNDPNKYEGAGIQFLPENKCNLTLRENFRNILKLNPNSHGAVIAQFNPI